MKYNIPAAVICDQCAKTTAAALMVIEPTSDIMMQNVVLPEGWIGEEIHPSIIPASGGRVTVDIAATPPHKLASTLGRPVRALWCSKACQDLARGHDVVRTLLVP